MLLQRPRSPQSCHQFIHQKPSPLYMRKIWWQTQIRFRPIRNRKQKCTIWSSDVPIPQQPFTRKNNDPREMVIRRISCLHSSTSSRMDQQYVIRHDKFRRLPRHDILRPHIPQELQTSKIPTQKWPILKTQTTQIQHRLLRIKLAFPYLDIGLRPFHLETSGGESLDRKSGVPEILGIQVTYYTYLHISYFHITLTKRHGNGMMNSNRLRMTGSLRPTGR